MFLVYGDDSADERKERVCAIGIVVGHEDRWKATHDKWELRNHGVPFHAKDCESDYGDFAQFSHEDNKARYRDMTTILAESGLEGLGVAIDLVAQEKVFPGSAELAYFKAFTEILERVKVFAVQNDESVKFTFDISADNRYNAAYVYQSIVANDRTALSHFDPEISFAPAKQCSRLQAGDLMAYESMKALDHTVGPKKRRRRSWEALHATGRFEVVAFSEEWFSSLSSQFKELEGRVGYTAEDYFTWLRHSGRQDNISNKYLFTDLMWKQDRKDGKL